MLLLPIPCPAARGKGGGAVSDSLRALLGLPDQGPLLIALVGAGGKTTTLLALAREYKDRGCRVLVTTTTRIYVPQERDRLLLGPPDKAAEAGAEAGTITVAGNAVEPNGKLVGFPEAWLDRMHRQGAYDVILTEADGSKGLPLKAPAAYEPVIPDGATDVIGVIGMDAWGRPADDRTVHRLEHFCEVTGALPGQTIDNGLLLKLIDGPQGLFKGVPRTARRHLLLNKCNDPIRLAAARELLAQCSQTGAGALHQGACR